MVAEFCSQSFRQWVLSAVFIGLTVATARALINPKFTPVHLVQQSATILELKFRGDVNDGKATATVVRTLKGTFAKTALEIDLTATVSPDQAQMLEKVLKESPDKAALMFVGAWPEKPGEQDGAEAMMVMAEAQKAFVHIEGLWLVLSEDKGAWKFEQMSQPLVATWNGGTDMLLKAVRYVLDDPAADVPVRTGVTWARVLKLGKIAGKPSAAVPVDLKGTGTPVLFVASETGDRLFACTGAASDDITTKCRLQSRSSAFAWADFNGDGLLDLVSWDGKKLTLWLLGTDGSFTATAGAKELADCQALAAMDSGTVGKPALLVTARGAPMRLIPGPDAIPNRIVEGDVQGTGLGSGGACLVADFDGDAMPDIVQPFSRGSLYYKGTAPGAFAPPVACPIALGEGAGQACLGDWDGDGLLDVFCAGNDRCRFWQNTGGGRFTDMMKLTGELSYVAKGSAVVTCMGDLNNDGRQDGVVLYSNMAPQVFFNRGFRSFGFSVSLDLGRGTLLPEATTGQQAGCIADFNGDGAQDVAMVLKDGECVVVARTPSGADLCARVMVSPKCGRTGPVRVWAMADNRPLGAWNVCAGTAPAILSRPDAGPLKIHWQFPGQGAQFRDVVLEDKPLSVFIEPPAVK